MLTKKKAARKKAPVKKKTPAKKQVKSTKKKSATRKVPSKKTKPKTKPKAKPKTKPKAKPKAKPKTKPKAKPKTKAKTKAKTKPKTKPKTKAKTKAKAKLKTKAKAKLKSTKTARLGQPKSTAAVPPALKPKKVRLNATTRKIRDTLIQNQNELLAIIRSNQAIERNATEAIFSNEIDLASDLEGREMMFQLTSRDRSELKMIEEAIYKINTGTYGICEACSKQISPKRLRILPLSTLCINCKESMEHL